MNLHFRDLIFNPFQSAVNDGLSTAENKFSATHRILKENKFSFTREQSTEVKFFAMHFIDSLIPNRVGENSFSLS